MNSDKVERFLRQSVYDLFGANKLFYLWLYYAGISLDYMLYLRSEFVHVCVFLFSIFYF